ncbi:protein disulfide isomerase family protein [Candidatus Uabimicrobium amorphum]|uniref:Thioredoxin domain-containing protein n=1 Tax=Uabimicrobium amorphum TaxID=2596890 RepID=A0A5S9F4K3_UABAM|nr:protein disulfide isomerase family protein [Candidatus Uabimicrobium amorphum]BBM84312.1 hypothetical protein UABAM_02669 [Candidatus Uabimicrobium amorphum]
MVNVAANYSDDQVLIATVDAYVNSELKEYLLGGYPTVRTFSKGKVGGESFVGSKDEGFITAFIDRTIKGNNASPAVARGKLHELKTTAEFENLVKNSQVPVMVKFSASW